MEIDAGGQTGDLTAARLSAIQPCPMADTPRERRRSLVSLGDLYDQLAEQAEAKGLSLATYLRSLLATHPEVTSMRPRRGAGAR